MGTTTEETTATETTETAATTGTIEVNASEVTDSLSDNNDGFSSGDNIISAYNERIIKLTNDITASTDPYERYTAAQALGHFVSSYVFYLGSVIGV